MAEPAVARLLFPAIRWDTQHGFASARELIEEALSLGVGGLIIFGGDARAVRELTGELHERSAHPLLIGADLERGAGQQFIGGTPLPPLAAFGHIDDVLVTRRAGFITGREARALGVNWIYAPVADLDIEPRNPIVGTRSFGSDPERVAKQVTAWIEGCREAGALACAKHFPGHGRTVTDSHAELPEVLVDTGALQADLRPFEAAIKVDVDSLMSAHVRYPALDTSGAPATLSARVLTGLLRERLDFRGLIVTDAMNMAGVIEGGGDENTAAALAVAAGCDALLYPSDVKSMIAALRDAIGKQLDAARVNDAISRIDRAARTLREPLSSDWGLPEDRAWAIELGARSIHVVRGVAHIRDSIELLTIDDDLGGPYPAPSRDHFPLALEERGLQVRRIDAPTAGCVVAVYCDVRAWKKRQGLSADSINRVNEAIVKGASLIVLFGHSRIAGQVKGADLICAWGGEPLMQEAAAYYLGVHHAVSS